VFAVSVASEAGSAPLSNATNVSSIRRSRGLVRRLRQRSEQYLIVDADLLGLPGDGQC